MTTSSPSTVLAVGARLSRSHTGARGYQWENQSKVSEVGAGHGEVVAAAAEEEGEVETWSRVERRRMTSEGGGGGGMRSEGKPEEETRGGEGERREAGRERRRRDAIRVEGRELAAHSSQLTAHKL